MMFILIYFNIHNLHICTDHSELAKTEHSGCNFLACSNSILLDKKELLTFW